MAKKTKSKTNKKPVVKKELSPWIMGCGIAFAIIVFVALMVSVIAPAMGYFATNSDWAKTGRERRKQATITKEKEGLEAAAVVLSDVRQKLIDTSPYFANLSAVRRECNTNYAGFNYERRCSAKIKLPRFQEATYEQYDSMESLTKNVLKEKPSFMITNYPQPLKSGVGGQVWDSSLDFKLRDYPELQCSKWITIQESTEQTGQKYIDFGIGCSRKVTEYVYPSEDL